jgi:predicted nuclease of restriction endonuclease-like (RecB) superfamily
MLNDLTSDHYKSFLETLKLRVEQSRYQAARKVNKELILLYHHIGAEIIKNQKKFGWGAKVIDQLSKDLKNEFPDIKGFIVTNLKYMKFFAKNFTVDSISQQAADQLPWFHLVTILTEVRNKRLSFNIRLC